MHKKKLSEIWLSFDVINQLDIRDNFFLFFFLRVFLNLEKLCIVKRVKKEFNTRRKTYVLPFFPSPFLALRYLLQKFDIKRIKRAGRELIAEPGAEILP